MANFFGGGGSGGSGSPTPPGGVNEDLQFNDAGSFGGISPGNDGDFLASSSGVWAVTTPGLEARTDADGTVLIALTDNAKQVNVTHGTANAITNFTTGLVAGFVTNVCNMGTGTATFTPAAGTVNGAATFSFNTQYTCARLRYDGTNWEAALALPAIPSDANLVTSDVTTNNASTTKHGFLKKLSNVSTEYMDGTGNWSTPAGGSGNTITVANEGVTGTTVNKLAKLTGAPSTAIILATTDTGLPVGIVTGGAGTTGSATIQVSGIAPCVFDGATTAGNFVTRSGATAGNCVDAGPTISAAAGTGIIGIVLSTNGGAGTYNVLLKPDLRNIFGTANQVLIAGTAGGGIRLALPQAIHTGASPSFNEVSASVFKTGATGSVTVKAGDGSGGNNGGALTVFGGDASGGNGTGGGATFRGGNATGTGAAGNATVQGGNNTGTGAGGNLTLRPGGSSNATPGNPGRLEISGMAIDGGTITSGGLQCASANRSAANCASTSATNFLGVALTTADPVEIQFAGSNRVPIPLDVTSAGRCNGTNCTTTVGDFVCSSANSASQVQVFATACPAGRQLGIIFVAETSVTSLGAGSVWLQIK